MNEPIEILGWSYERRNDGENDGLKEARLFIDLSEFEDEEATAIFLRIVESARQMLFHARNR